MQSAKLALLCGLGAASWWGRWRKFIFYFNILLRWLAGAAAGILLQEALNHIVRQRHAAIKTRSGTEVAGAGRFATSHLGAELLSAFLLQEGLFEVTFIVHVVLATVYNLRAD
jgi:hypothetical protein